MDPWLGVLCVILLAVLGTALGRVSSRLGGRFWSVGFVLSLLVIAALICVRHIRLPHGAAFFSWFATDWPRFLVLSPAIAMGLTTPMSRIRSKTAKVATCAVMIIFVLSFTVSPFLIPALLKQEHSRLRTRIDRNGICLQTTDYTCGPAAAVTALGKLGLRASEGEIAVLSNTSPTGGTLPWSLCTALQRRYRKSGLRCRYRNFATIEELKDAGVALVVVKEAFMLDHWVAVLSVSDRMIVLADPGVGKRLMRPEQFEKIWRFCGIVLEHPITRARITQSI
jgi:predicted double-glycine peptidase